MNSDDYDLGPYWAEAKRAYELECEHPLDFDPEAGGPLRDPQTVDQMLELIESRGARFKTFREKHSRLWTKLKTFAEPVVIVGKLTGDAFEAAGDFGSPAGAILKSITHLVSVSCVPVFRFALLRSPAEFEPIVLSEASKRASKLACRTSRAVS
jgi:hypothetical protein